MGPRFPRCRAALAFAAALLATGVPGAWARQVTPDPQVGAAPQTAPSPATAAAQPGHAASTAPVGTTTRPLPAAVRPTDLWPPLAGPALTWFAVIVILALTIRLRPLLSERNLDGLVLAATCLLLALRTDLMTMPAWAAGQTGQWWSYLLLSVAAGYWLLRGLRVLVARTVPRYETNAAPGAILILALAGLAVSLGRIAGDPLSPGARDGLVGGLFMAETGKLPYGQIRDHDARSPLLYTLFAGAVRIFPPRTSEPSLTPVAQADELSSALSAGQASPPLPRELLWENRADWLGRPEWMAGDYAAVRLVNGVLFLLMLLALYTLGARLHSAAMGLTLIALFCVFPGAVESLSRPAVMLPAVLLAWSFAFALLPGFGGLLSGLTIVLAGLAWPWAWLAIPVLLAYFFRHGWEAVGGVVGVAAGTAAVLAGLAWLTQPMPPRAAGALARAGQLPDYVVTRTGPGELVVERRSGVQPAETGWLQPFWRFLVDSENHLLDTASQVPGHSHVQLAVETDPRKVLYRNLDVTPEARAELSQRYEIALASEPAITRMLVALRTVLEHTWLVEPPPAARGPDAWALWSAGSPADGTWVLVHKIVKLAAGVLALVVGLIVFLQRTPLPHNLAGGLLAVSAAALLADRSGAVANLAWLMPTVLALWAANRPPAAAAVPALAPLEESYAFGQPAPRITVER